MAVGSLEAPIEFQDYLVLFVDVLGQRQRLRAMTGVPTNAEERTTFIEVLRQTLNVVLTLRESLRANIFYHWFSDSMIVAVPL